MVEPFFERVLKSKREQFGVKLPLILIDLLVADAKKQKTTRTKILEIILINHYKDKIEDITKEKVG